MMALSATTLLLAGGAFAAAQDDAGLYAVAQKEAGVNWYTGLLKTQIVQPLITGFEAKYPGVRVEHTTGSDAELLDKIVAEAHAGTVHADVSLGPSMAGQLLEAGLVARYIPANAANVPAQYKDPRGLWTAPTLFFIVPAINTNLVKSGEEPRTLEDLLDPKWRGKMVWSGEVGTSGQVGFIGAVLNYMGESKGKAYLRKLAAQQVVTLPSSARAVLDRVIAGEYPIGLATYNHHSSASQAKGAPVRWLPLQPIVSVMARSMLLKGAPHPNAAKLLINYLLSPEGQQVFRDAGYIPSISSVQPKDPSLKIDPARFKMFAPSPAEELQGMKEWLGLYKELFQ